MPASAAASATCGEKSPPGHRGDAHSLAEEVRRCVAAPRPLVEQLRERAVSHAQRMRAGVAADDVAAASRARGCRGVDEAARADVVRGDEEVPAKPRALEQVGRRHRAGAAIVERDSRAGAAGPVGRWGGKDRVEVRANSCRR